jgi:hypothetical protein
MLIAKHGLPGGSSEGEHSRDRDRGSSKKPKVVIESVMYPGWSNPYSTFDDRPKRNTRTMKKSDPNYPGWPQQQGPQDVVYNQPNFPYLDKPWMESVNEHVQMYQRYTYLPQPLPWSEPLTPPIKSSASRSTVKEERKRSKHSGASGGCGPRNQGEAGEQHREVQSPGSRRGTGHNISSASVGEGQRGRAEQHRGFQGEAAGEHREIQSPGPRRNTGHDVSSTTVDEGQGRSAKGARQIRQTGLHGNTEHHVSSARVGEGQGGGSKGPRPIRQAGSHKVRQHIAHKAAAQSTVSARTLAFQDDMLSLHPEDAISTAINYGGFRSQNLPASRRQKASRVSPLGKGIVADGKQWEQQYGPKADSARYDPGGEVVDDGSCVTSATMAVVTELLEGSVAREHAETRKFHEELRAFGLSNQHKDVRTGA